MRERTDFAAHLAEKGALWLEVSTAGRVAHGSAPHEGLNAILPPPIQGRAAPR
ncbi:MAG: peptidase dimerization domain-containing protein [candidate division NC10 bacterium]|nr:peptidase dimerization domain-containing protein [candidate division NC10 bacterium]MBI4413798.1 peptidase dimerization domain-containing protein [candidate division NC10 bacterium]